MRVSRRRDASTARQILVSGGSEERSNRTESASARSVPRTSQHSALPNVVVRKPSAADADTANQDAAQRTCHAGMPRRMAISRAMNWLSIGRRLRAHAACVTLVYNLFLFGLSFATRVRTNLAGALNRTLGRITRPLIAHHDFAGLSCCSSVLPQGTRRFSLPASGLKARALRTVTSQVSLPA